MTYTIYNPNTGEIEYTLSTSDDVSAQMQLTGKSYVNGSYSSSEYYVDNGNIIQKPTCPTAPNCNYIFNCVEKTWMLDADRSSWNVRNVRNQLLEDIDRINPIWYASLSVDQQNQLIEYRQVLLAVPQQSGFPETVTWPVKPTWLS